MYRVVLLPALAWFSLAAQAPPPEAILKQAITSHQSGDIDGAIREYREYLKLRPDSFPARANLGAALARAGRYDEAIEEYNGALAIQPHNPQLLMNVGLAFFKTNRIAEARERFEAALSAIPGNRQVTLLLADCDIRMGDNKKAVELLTPLEKDNLNDQAFNYLLGTALIRDKQADKGSIVIDRILRNGDSAEAHLLMGTTRMFALDYSGSVPDLKKAVELNPKLPEAHSYYGQALLGTGDQQGAGVQFRKELELNPTDFLANLELGVLAKQDQNYAESRSFFERALRTRPGDLGVRYQLATINVATGKNEEARKELEDILTQAPEFTEAHISLATVYYRLKRKTDGDRERATAQKLLAEKQAAQPRGESK
jgi:tetratricopeptide (TPR) repeat protein